MLEIHVQGTNIYTTIFTELARTALENVLICCRAVFYPFHVLNILF